MQRRRKISLPRGPSRLSSRLVVFKLSTEGAIEGFDNQEIRDIYSIEQDRTNKSEGFMLKIVFGRV